jgi:glucose/mannose-6-phosphate isomerase
MVAVTSGSDYLSEINIFHERYLDDTMSFSLDDVEAMRKLDASKLISQIGDFLDHLETATRSKTERLSLPASVCLSGIGGSAIAADVLYDYLVTRSPVPVLVNRDVNLPNWLDGTGLSIITSYSGNTQEALEIFEQSIIQGCPTYCITSGGKLLKRADENGIPCLVIPSGLQPRAALGHLLGGAAAVLQSVDIAEPANDLLNAAINSRAAVARLAPSSPIERNVAKKYAQVLKDSLPVIYAPRNVRSLAVRWQNQINENAKMLAFSGEVPEMNHNQMVGVAPRLSLPRRLACLPAPQPHGPFGGEDGIGHHTNVDRGQVRPLGDTVAWDQSRRDTPIRDHTGRSCQLLSRHAKRRGTCVRARHPEIQGSHRLRPMHLSCYGR